jgi:hypothetical protein
MCKPKPNNCNLVFECRNLIECSGKKVESNENCKYQTDNYKCKNVILQVQSAVNFIKKNIGDNNFIKHVLKDINFYKKIDELEKEWSDNWDFADGYRKCIDDIQTKFDFPSDEQKRID